MAIIKRPELTYTSAIIAGTGLIAAWWLWERRRRRERKPEKWRKVGELTSILCYPIKSLGPVRLDSTECTQLGLKSGWIRDRTLMVIDLQGKCVTARHYPKMVKVRRFFSSLIHGNWLHILCKYMVLNNDKITLSAIIFWESARF